MRVVLLGACALCCFLSAEAAGCLRGRPLFHGPIRRAFWARVDARIDWYIHQVMTGRMHPSQIPKPRFRGPLARRIEARAKWRMERYIYAMKAKVPPKLPPPRKVLDDFPPPIGDIPTWDQWEKIHGVRYSRRRRR